jgi:hypothetical protein
MRNRREQLGFRASEKLDSLLRRLLVRCGPLVLTPMGCSAICHKSFLPRETCGFQSNPLAAF